MTRAACWRLSVMLASRCGYSADLSGPVNDRAMFHVDNAYFLEKRRDHLASLQDPYRVEYRVFAASVGPPGA